MLNQMLIFGLLIVVGVIVRKKGIINPQNLGQISSILVDYAIPSMILSSITGNGPHLSNSELVTVFGAVALTMALMLILNCAISWLVGYRQSIFLKPMVCLSTFTSIAMIGVPLIYALYGPDTLIYVTVVLLISNLLFFTFGFWCLGDSSHDYSFSWRKIPKFFNNGVIACLLALVLYVLNLRLPMILEEAIIHLGNMTAALSMLMIGAFLCDINWLDAVKDLRMWAYTFLKMVVIPLIGMWVLAQFYADNTILLAVLLATVATPAGAAAPVVIIKLNNNHDVYVLSLKAVAFTTISTVVTLPFVEWISRSFV